jgi:hypothetical protein
MQTKAVVESFPVSPSVWRSLSACLIVRFDLESNGSSGLGFGVLSSPLRAWLL